MSAGTQERLRYALRGEASWPPVRPWNVMHSAERIHDILELAEAQRNVGMRPVLVTPAGYGSIELYLRVPEEEERAVSLLGMWQDVRRWRKSMGDCATVAAMDVVHAHCFAAGMAGVRNWPAVVYDVRGCVDDGADTGQQWLGRSLRVAEQFVLARAGAIVVHWPSLRGVVIERGAAEEHVFVVPDAVAASAPEVDGGWRERLRIPADAVTLFAAEGADLDALLRAFAQVATEVVASVLLLPVSDPAPALVRDKVASAGISRAVRMVAPGDRDEILRSADVVITGAAPGNGPNLTGAAAMSAGRAVLAEDVPANRDLSPDGRGCLWFKSRDARDLAGRVSFLAREAEFRRSLGASARSYIEETRSAEVVARRYDAVYAHAHARRRDHSQQSFGSLQPLQAAF